MPKKRFTDEQIAFSLRQAESGMPVGEIGRKMGVAEATFYRWKKVSFPKIISAHIDDAIRPGWGWR